MIKKIRLQGLLSFDDMELELRNLNVLIGPNGSGKSNLIEALSLLQALPRNLGDPLNIGGGISEWLRHTQAGIGNTGDIDAWLDVPELAHLTFHYAIRLGSVVGRYEIAKESLQFRITDQNDDDSWKPLFERNQPDRTSMLAAPLGQNLGDIDISRIALAFSRFLLYRGWHFGISAPPRQHQPADLPPDFLLESTQNLALVVNEFSNMRVKANVEDEFRKFYNRCESLTVSIFGNQLILNMQEEGVRDSIPATRWSDGMIRYLCLLAILCHPNPPGLICIDEPELGFHPDILPNLARLIKSASERTQIIITTHSKQLVDEFSDDPEAVVVCERGFDGESTMRRLDATELHDWLKEYSLGELWEKGEIGGDLY